MAFALWKREVSRSLKVHGVLSVAVATLVLPVLSQAAATNVKDYSIHQTYLSPRALGMGNAFTAVADDHSTLLYNPAGLARIKEGQINLGIGGMIDSKIKKLTDDIDRVSKTDDASQMVELLESNYGNHYSARATVGGVWVRPKWGLAVIPVDISIDLEIHQMAMAALGVMATQDSTIAYGRGWDVNWFSNHRISLGVTGKAIYRTYYNQALLASDLIFSSDILRPQDAKEGFTFDADFGALWTPKVNGWVRPTFGLTVRNVADYGFKSNFHWVHKDSTEPPKMGRRFDVGSLLELPDWWIFKTRVAADLRDMGHENWTFKKGSHLGAEFLWKVRSWWQGGWRVGLNQGYFTAGFTGEIGMFKLDLATYAEEVGTSDTPKANRRYVAKASLDW